MHGESRQAAAPAEETAQGTPLCAAEGAGGRSSYQEPPKHSYPFFFKSSPKDLFLLIREREEGREGERNVDVR